jgi:hypothetical protein
VVGDSAAGLSVDSFESIEIRLFSVLLFTGVVVVAVSWLVFFAETFLLVDGCLGCLVSTVLAAVFELMAVAVAVVEMVVIVTVVVVVVVDVMDDFLAVAAALLSDSASV